MRILAGKIITINESFEHGGDIPKEYANKLSDMFELFDGIIDNINQMYVYIYNARWNMKFMAAINAEYDRKIGRPMRVSPVCDL